MTTNLLTAEEFAEQKPDLPEGGRWVELVRGEIIVHDPPSESHGDVVLNLSKQLAAHLHQRTDDDPGYASFEIGVVVARGPDTVRFPAVSFFTTGNRFEATDLQITERVPELVIEIVSTNSRRNETNRRVREYHALGTEHIWIIDPIDAVVHVCRRGRPTSTMSATEAVSGENILPGFTLTGNQLFAPPVWWK